MAYKVEKKEFDWDIEIPIVSEDGKQETVILKCIHTMNTENYNKFMEHLKKYIPNEKEKEEMTKNVDQEKGIVLIVKQIDFLYKKGVEWWLKNVNPQTIFGIQKYILSFNDVVGLKKTS